MDYKHTIINKVHAILVETTMAREKIKTQEFRLYLEKKFPSANGDFMLLFRDIENHYYHIDTGEKILPHEVDGNLSKMAWKADNWRI